MAEQSGRQPFRFRIPWVMYTAPTAPRPPTQPQQPTAPRPPTQPQQTQPTASVRPPFRPPGVASPRLPSQPQVPPKIESQPPPPARTAASRPSSPAKNVPPQPQSNLKPESQPSSPIQTSPQSRVASQPSSPSKTAPSQLQTPAKPESQPKSPTRTAPQSQVTSRTAPSQLQTPTKPESQPMSPTRTAPQSQVTSQPSPFRVTITGPQTPARTDSQPPSPALTTSKSQIPPELLSPSYTASKPQEARQTSSQTSSPSLATIQPQRASQPPSPLQKTLQLATKTSSQPPSPSRMASQVEELTQKASQTTSQTSSPSLTTIQPQQASQPPSPLQKTSQLAIKTSSQPPSPSRMASQVEEATQKAPKPLSPLILAPESRPTTRASIQPQSPRSSASRTELPFTKMAPTQSEISEPLLQYSQEAERSTEKTYQPDLKTKPPTGSPSVLTSLSPHSAPETEILRRDSGSNISKGQLDTSEEEKQQKQADMHEKDMLAKVAAGEEQKPAVPTAQNESLANTGSNPSGPQGERASLHKEIRDEISRFALNPQKTIDENQVSVITLTGENTGATMHLGSESAKKESSVHIQRGYKLNQEDISEATTDGENSAKQRFKDPKTREDTASMTYINNNIQSVNNSIMSNSSIHEGSPGVHVAFTHYPNEPMKSNRNTESVEARKADFNITQPQKLTYEPAIKRRCLRGLFLEPSDSDPDNPDKPRRHGCRYDFLKEIIPPCPPRNKMLPGECSNQLEATIIN